MHPSAKTAKTLSEILRCLVDLDRVSLLFAWVVLIAIGISATGCRKESNAVREMKPRTQSRSQKQISGGSQQANGRPKLLNQIPGRASDRHADFLKPILDHLDPKDDGWDTEVFAEAASNQLERLGKLWQHPTDLDRTALSNLFSTDFKATDLRQPNLKNSFEDASLQVLTARPLSSELENRTAVAVLQQLAEPLVAAKNIRTKFKLFRVDPNADGIDGGETSTDIYFEASGDITNGRLQQNATWRIRWTADSPPLIHSLQTLAYEEIVPMKSGTSHFVDVTQTVFRNADSFTEQLTLGVDHWRNRLEANYGVDPNGNQGIAIGDANGDGLDDLFVCQQGGLPNRLYLRNQEGTMKDVSAESGVNWMEVCRSALFVDLDNDGDQDLVMAQGWHLMIMKNDGTGKFSVSLEERSQANLYSVTAADFDLDGDLDLFFCGRNPAREQGKPEGILGTPIPYHDANNGGPNILLRNDGGLRFHDATHEVGLDTNNRRYSYAASWEDFDGDGDSDLYVANDFGRNNLYRNDMSADGKITFVDIAMEAGVEDISAGMSVTCGDYNGDGLPDIYVSNMFSSAGNRIAYQRNFRSTSDSRATNSNTNNETKSAFQRHARGNTLFTNLGNGKFADSTVESGVMMGRWAWGAKFLDFNNDGRQDLYVSNGFITTQDTGDL